MSLNNYLFEPCVDPNLIPTLVYYQTIWDTLQREVYHHLSTNPHYFSHLRRSRLLQPPSTPPSETSTHDDMSDTTTTIVDHHDDDCPHSYNTNQEISSSPPAADTTPQFAINADQYQLLQEDFQQLVQVSEVEVMLATRADHKEKIKQRFTGEDILEHEKEKMAEMWENYVYAQQQQEESALLNGQAAKRNGGLGHQHHHHGYGGGGRHASGDLGSLHYEADVDMPDL
ncbi:hypothetical protein EX30DRAFT_339243 [Ascodesmis nigricans]|uniref:Uncharacterized protein n=1 Tax=Ascodesmis nigricans TaxID=341454 RepID=A0A4S2N1P3_9PEZI|nr:hypothetical protein EX30DRAFT_339243 [Ascodesmis nigricans]